MKSNLIPLSIFALVLVAGAYWYFTSQSGNQAPLTTSASNNAAQAQFQTLVAELQPITFPTTIFSDPRFTSLVNISVPITPEPAGRIDPFAPVPGVTGQ
jgi:hypothetical protein